MKTGRIIIGLIVILSVTTIIIVSGVYLLKAIFEWAPSVLAFRDSVCAFPYLIASSFGTDPQDYGNEKITMPNILVQANVVHAGEETVYIFESYIVGISEDGQRMDNIDFNWALPPHFFHCDPHLTILYLGENREILNKLEEMLGPQFSGSPYQLQQ